VKPILEIACFNVEAALSAAKAGAHRIELCQDYLTGGLTPSQKNIETVLEAVNIPVHVMIRPRPGNFIYTVQEINSMLKSIDQVKQAGAAGVVLGLLTIKNQINRSVLSEFIDAAKGIHTVFHRAIDECSHLDESITLLAECGVTHVLTSGGASNALLGAPRIACWQNAIGQKIEIIVGGGVRSHNLKALKDTTQCNAFHSAAINAPGESPDIEEIKKLVHLVQ